MTYVKMLCNTLPNYLLIAVLLLAFLLIFYAMRTWLTGLLSWQEEDNEPSFFRNVILGIFFHSSVCMAGNFFFKTDRVFSLGLLCFDCLILLIVARQFLRKQKSCFRVHRLADWRIALFLIPLLLCTVGAAGRVGNYDSGLYHFNMIRWINEYPVIPGLTNLHGRLDFNQLFFFLTAWLNMVFPISLGYTLANPCLMLAAQIFFLKLFLFPDQLKTEWNFLQSLLALFFFFLFSYLSRWLLSSPSPDLFSSVLQGFFLFELIALHYADAPKIVMRFQFLLLLATFMILVKISNIYLAVSGIAVTFFLYRKIIVANYRKILPVFIIVLLLTSVWIIRGYILSGYPFYPVKLFAIDFPWTVEEKAITGELNAIRGWARTPNKNYLQSLHGFSWIIPWIKQYLNFLSQVFGIFTSGLLALVFFHYSYRAAKHRLFLFPMAVSVAAFSIVAWFFSAPDIRFSEAIILTFACYPFLVFCTLLAKHVPPHIVLTCIALPCFSLLFLSNIIINTGYVVHGRVLSGRNADYPEPMLGREELSPASASLFSAERRSMLRFTSSVNLFPGKSPGSRVSERYYLRRFQITKQ